MGKDASDDIVRRYNVQSFAEQYARRNFSRPNPTGIYKNRELSIVTKDLLKDCMGKRIVDVGCGEGSYAIALAINNDVVAIDASTVLLQTVAKKAANFKKLRMMHMDARNLTFGEGTFDVALCIDLLHHYPDEECLGILRQIRRVLKPHSGELITEFKNVRNPLIRRSYARWMKNRFREDGFYVKARSHTAFSAILARAGFSIQSSKGVLSPLKRFAPAILLKCHVS